MKSINIPTVLLYLICICSTINAQVDSTKTVEDLVKTDIEESTENSKNPELYDLIEDLLKNPININSATVEELTVIPFLDYESARLIIKHRKNHGEFTNVNELRGVTGLDKSIRNKIKPFLTVSVHSASNKSFPQILSIDVRSRYIYNLQESNGFLTKDFLGSRIKSYQRINAKYNRFRIGLLAEKDAGETSFADHNTFFVEGKKLGILNHFVLGDFLVEFGQGLVLWSPYSFSKGSDAINPLSKRSRNIIGYSSADENNYFRGGAASIDYSKFRFTFFYSSNPIDGNLNDSTYQITSFPQDGFHRTESELLKKNTINEKMYGGRIDFSLKNNLNIGILYFNDSFDKPIKKNSIFSPVGRTFDFYSISYKIFLNKMMIFGESAFNGISTAHISSVEFSVVRNFVLITSVRSYPRNFYTFHAQGFGERSTTINEVGFYTGIKWKTNFGIFNFYFDQFKFPFSTSSIPLPSTGNEFLINFKSTAFNKTKITLRYKNENKEVSQIVNNNRIILNKITNNIRLDILSQVSKTIRLRSRVEFTYIDKTIINSSENGFLAFQDLQWKPIKQLSFYGRFIFFQTHSFESRIYEFENDLTGILNNPALFDKGMRLYIMIRYKVRHLQFSAKYSELYKPNETSLGSGLSRIIGNLNNTMNFQIDYDF